MFGRLRPLPGDVIPCRSIVATCEIDPKGHGPAGLVGNYRAFYARTSMSLYESRDLCGCGYYMLKALAGRHFESHNFSKANGRKFSALFINKS